MGNYYLPWTVWLHFLSTYNKFSGYHSSPAGAIHRVWHLICGYKEQRHLWYSYLAEVILFPVTKLVPDADHDLSLIVRQSLHNIPSILLQKHWMPAVISAQLHNIISAQLHNVVYTPSFSVPSPLFLLPATKKASDAECHLSSTLQRCLHAILLYFFQSSPPTTFLSPVTEVISDANLCSQLLIYIASLSTRHLSLAPPQTFMLPIIEVASNARYHFSSTLQCNWHAILLYFPFPFLPLLFCLFRMYHFHRIAPIRFALNEVLFEFYNIQIYENQRNS